jgi:two-component system response regulator DevR
MQHYVSGAIRVYLVDDHDIVRRGLRDLLAVQRDITVVGDSGSAEASVERIIALSPDVMVLDLQLQDGSGVQVCRRVRSVVPSTQALLLTSASDDEALQCAVLAGAAGYATKLVDSGDILADIRQIGAGRSLIEPAVVERVRADLASDHGRAAGLDDQQRELLGHVVDGLTDDQIAEVTSRPIEAVSAGVLDLVRSLTGQS